MDVHPALSLRGPFLRVEGLRPDKAASQDGSQVCRQLTFSASSALQSGPSTTTVGLALSLVMQTVGAVQDPLQHERTALAAPCGLGSLMETEGRGGDGRMASSTQWT